MSLEPSQPPWKLAAPPLLPSFVLGSCQSVPRSREAPPHPSCEDRLWTREAREFALFSSGESQTERPGPGEQHLLAYRPRRSLPQKSGGSPTREGRRGRPAVPVLVGHCAGAATLPLHSHPSEGWLLENKLFLTLVTDGEADVIQGCHMGAGTQQSDSARGERDGAQLRKQRGPVDIDSQGASGGRWWEMTKRKPHRGGGLWLN